MAFMEQIQIRECVEEDVIILYELNKNEMGYDYPRDKTETKLRELLKSNKEKIFVAVMDNIVVGYVHANDYDVIYASHMKNIMGIALPRPCNIKVIGTAISIVFLKWAQ